MNRIFFMFIFLFFLLVSSVKASEKTNASFERRYEGEVIRILEDKFIEVSAGVKQPYQKVEVRITSGNLKKQNVIAELGGMVVTNENLKVKTGDKIMVINLKKTDGTEKYYVGDFIRRTPLYLLVLAFAFAVIIVGGIRGFTSFIGLIISFLILIKFMIPQIMEGANPVFIAIFSSFMILVATLYLAHGISKKTTAAFLGTSVSLVITGILALYFVNLLRLSGFGSEEASFLSTLTGSQINLQGILLAGIIIGALGVLDDITVSQSSAVFEIHNANRNLPWSELYKRGLRIGQDHIASLVNTLVLAYAGASLPLLLLFAFSGGEPISILMNREMIANEIVRTIVGSLGLVSAVPITTAIASKMCRS